MKEELLKISQVIETAISAFEKEGNARVQAARDRLDALANNVDRADKAFFDAQKANFTEAAKRVKEAMSLLDKQVSDYMDLVRESDGLLQAKPSITRAMDRYRSRPKKDDKDIDTAVSELAKQRKELLKTQGGDEDKIKEIADGLLKIIRTL